MTNFITTKNILIKRSQFLIHGFSKNSYTMYNDGLAVYRVRTVDSSPGQ